MRDGFVSFARGEWQMPPKVYLPSPPNGDFRAMPVRGEGLAILKWITSFPGNPRRGLPTVTGRGAGVGRRHRRAAGPARRARGDGPAHRGGRRGRDPGARAGGCAIRSAWSVAVCMVYGWAAAWRTRNTVPASASTLIRTRRAMVAAELGWEVGDARGGARVRRGLHRHAGKRAGRAGRRAARRPAPQPARAPTGPARRRPRSPRSSGRFGEGRLFCDEWQQASHGGELTGAVAAGNVGPEDVTELGAVCAGLRPGRTARREITLFDSTGLAIQDLAIALGALESLRAGAVKAADRSPFSYPALRASAGTPCGRPAAVAAQPAAAVQHAVAGHHDRDRVGAERVARPRARRGGCRPPRPCSL